MRIRRGAGLPRASRRQGAIVSDSEGRAAARRAEDMLRDRYEHALNDCSIHANVEGIRERTACAVCFTEVLAECDRLSSAVEALTEQWRANAARHRGAKHQVTSSGLAGADRGIALAFERCAQELETALASRRARVPTGGVDGQSPFSPQVAIRHEPDERITGGRRPDQ
jgi:hypothetical protein